MSQWASWKGRPFPRRLLMPHPSDPPGSCVECGGLGMVPERLDEERMDVMVACWRCTTWCNICGKRVAKSAHVCVGQ